MNYLRTAHEREAYRRVFYGDTEVYINKLGIRDQKLLEDTDTRANGKGAPKTDLHGTAMEPRGSPKPINRLTLHRSLSKTVWRGALAMI